MKTSSTWDSSPAKNLRRAQNDIQAPPSNDVIRIGIPRAIMAFDMLPLWKTFFEELGHEIVVSPPTNQKLFDEGLKHLTTETCLPIKAFCSHIHWLQTNGEIDHIFVPSFVVTGKDVHDRSTLHCPYVQSLAQFAQPIAKVPLLKPVINWTWHPKDEDLEMIAMACGLGHSKHRAKAAWEKAQHAQELFRSELRRMGNEVLDKLKSGDLKRVFVILGKDYNIGDPFLNSQAIEVLEALGETIITQDMLTDDKGRYPKTFKSMYWSHGKEILAAAEIASKTPGLYPVLITSFGCGPDSFTLGFAKEILNTKPMLVLEVDEHSSSVGMETRIEAFIDSLPISDFGFPISDSKDQKSDNTLPQSEIRSPKSPNYEKKIKRVFLPNFSDHGYAFAAAIKSLGLEPVLTSIPDDESTRLGAEHSNDGECHPYTLMLGSYLKTATSGEDFSDACYYMPDSGACRVGQFGAQMRIAAKRIDSKLPIFTTIDELKPSMPNPSSLSGISVLITYWEMMRGMDFLMQKFFETRAYEREPGSTERAHAKGQEILLERIMDDRPHDGLTEAIEILESVPVDKSRKRVKIGITGDYYTRICDYSNSNIFDDIERLGGVIMLPPTMSEFVKYGTHQKAIGAFYHRDARGLLQNLIARKVVDDREKRVRKLFHDKLDYDIPLEYKRAMKYIAPYMNEKLPNGLTGSIAAILEQIHAGCDGILNIITFHCSYGLVINSILASIEKDYPHIPKLTLIFEGLKPTHNRVRLEAFMERVKSN